MTEIKPASFLQGETANNAITHRMVLNSLIVGKRASTGVTSRGGIVYGCGNSFVITTTGTMNITVGSGAALVPGSENLNQALYAVVNDATVTLTPVASESLPRIDIVVLQIEDDAYSGSVHDWNIKIVKGTANASPVVPSTPNNSIKLCNLAIPASATSLSAGQVTDLRFFASAIGGKIYCSSTLRPDTTLVPDGQEIYEIDTKLTYILKTSSWVPLPDSDQMGRGLISVIDYVNLASPITATAVTSTTPQPITVQSPAGTAVTIGATVAVVSGRWYEVKLIGSLRNNTAGGFISLGYTTELLGSGTQVDQRNDGPYTNAFPTAGTYCERTWKFIAPTTGTYIFRPKHFYFTSALAAAQGWCQTIRLEITDKGVH